MHFLCLMYLYGCLEPLKLAAAMLYPVQQHFKKSLVNILLIESNVELSAQLACRGFRTAEIIPEQRGCPALETLGDIRENRNARAPHLVPQFLVGTKSTAPGGGIYFRAYQPRGFPHFKIIKTPGKHTTTTSIVKQLRLVPPNHPKCSLLPTSPRCHVVTLIRSHVNKS